MDLRAKYDQAIQTAKRARVPGGGDAAGRQAQLQGNRAFRGRKEPDLECDQDGARLEERHHRRHHGGRGAGGGRHVGASGGRTYTVKSGDTLSKIAKEHLGDANAYMKIFDANKDQLTDPDKIKPGQVLKIPV